MSKRMKSLRFMMNFKFFVLLCFVFCSGCLELDRFFNESSKRERTAKKIEAQEFFVGKVKKLIKDKRFKKPIMKGTVNSLGLWMAKEICPTPLYKFELKYHELLIEAKKMVNKKEVPDQFFALFDEIEAHNNKMNIEYSMVCQKNPSGDDMKKVNDGDVIANTTYHLHRKCKDRYKSKVFTALVANNLFLFCN